MDKKIDKKELIEAEEKYAGVAVDRADDDKVSNACVKQETNMLNNNPRNTDE